MTNPPYNLWQNKNYHWEIGVDQNKWVFIATPNQEKVEEVGRIIYQNGNITVNVGAILAVATLALLGKSKKHNLCCLI